MRLKMIRKTIQIINIRKPIDKHKHGGLVQIIDSNDVSNIKRKKRHSKRISNEANKLLKDGKEWQR